MLTFLINLFRGNSNTIAGLDRKRHYILSSFYKMSRELATLHDEQITAIRNLEVKLAELESEKREVEQMARSTEKTVAQIQKIVGES